MTRYFIGFLVAIGLIILLIILIVHGGGKPPVPTTKATLESYANTDATVRLTIDGPINAAENHNAAQITVGRSSATFELMQGYDGTVVNSKSYASSEAGYDVFLHALDYAGFTKGNDASDLKDERGYCPLGDRYVFELIQNGNDVERYWATNCGSAPKSFEGNLSLNLALFQAQIPDYNTLLQNADL